MKNLLFKQVLFFTIFLFFFFPLISWAELVPCFGYNLVTKEDECDFQMLGRLANNVVGFIVFSLAVPVATIAILVSGVMLVIYSSNPGKRSEALNILKIAGLGLILVLSGYLVIQAIVFGLTGQSQIGSSLNSIFQR